jgi:hypothetical protein
MVMSGNTILAPRDDSDPAIDGAARGAAGGAVDRYRTWVGDHRVSAALLAGLIATHVDGIVFTVVLAVAVYPLLRWRSAIFGNTLKGLALGVRTEPRHDLQPAYSDGHVTARDR